MKDPSLCTCSSSLVTIAPRTLQEGCLSSKRRMGLTYHKLWCLKLHILLASKEQLSLHPLAAVGQAEGLLVLFEERVLLNSSFRAECRECFPLLYPHSRPCRPLGEIRLSAKNTAVLLTHIRPQPWTDTRSERIVLWKSASLSLWEDMEPVTTEGLKRRDNKSLFLARGTRLEKVVESSLTEVSISTLLW